MPIGLISLNDGTMREDVTNFITNIDYESTPFYSNLGEAQATNTLHQWLEDTHAAPADNAQAEGYTTTYTDITAAVRNTNVVQLFGKDIRVSNTEQRVSHYGPDPYTYQLNKKMKELARDIELALVAGTRASGNSGVARRLDGAIALITTNKTARASGTSFSETEFNDMLQNIFDNGSDVSIDRVFTGATLKRAISGYTGQNTTKFTDATTGKVYNAVSIYESDFGVHMVHLERQVPSGANAKGVLGVDSSKWRVAYLTDGKPQHIPMGLQGSAKVGIIETELTLEALAEKSSAYRSGY
jgi:hypothetical protein